MIDTSSVHGGRSPKTEHHAGGGQRSVPIFTELLPYMEAAYDAAPEGATHMITRYRGTNVNLRTQLLRILRRAGVPAWPKLFVNLRSSRQTELCEGNPDHVVATWLGNSVAVARAHYMQTTEEHYRKGAGLPPRADDGAAKKGAEKVTQKVTLHSAAPDCMEQHQTREPRRKHVSPGVQATIKHPHGDANTSSFLRAPAIFRIPRPNPRPTSTRWPGHCSSSRSLACPKISVPRWPRR